MTRRDGKPIAMLILLLFVGISGASGAAGKDATGTWTLAIEPFDGKAQPGTLKLEQESETLTGKFTHPNGQSLEIREGKIHDGQVSFFVQAGPNGPKIHHHGKLEGDTIKGKLEFER